jgi:hypothetical protein
MTIFNKDITEISEIPESSFTPIPAKELEMKTKEQMKDFTNLLNSLDVEYRWLKHLTKNLKYQMKF